MSNARFVEESIRPKYDNYGLKQHKMTKETGETISFKQAIGSAGEFISIEKRG